MGQNSEINGVNRYSDDLRSHKAADPRLMQSALQLLLKRCQMTGFLVDDRYRLVAVYHDALGLFTQTEPSQHIASLLPASLASSAHIVLQQAQAGEASQEHHQIDLPACVVTLTASRHSVDAKDFFTVLIKQVENGVQDEPGEDELASVLAENRYLRAQILAQEKNEQELAQQTRALARSNADLEEFAYVVSHDLQEPLRAMTAFSQLLQQRYEQHLDAAAKRYIKHIVDGGIRMKAMIDGILELSRINSNQPSSAIPTELKQAVDMALENLNIMCLETQSTITQSALPTLYVDKNHMVQLFQNLISNAIKFRGDAPPCVHISAEPQSGKWLFMVQDNGIGVPHSQQTRIFKLFQRLHNEQEQKGYGIGLAICKKIVEHYRGDIWLDSSPGKGSTVYFTLMFARPRKA